MRIDDWGPTDYALLAILAVALGGVAATVGFAWWVFG